MQKMFERIILLLAFGLVITTTASSTMNNTESLRSVDDNTFDRIQTINQKYGEKDDIVEADIKMNPKIQKLLSQQNEQTSGDKQQTGSKRKIFQYMLNQWPNATVPYVFASAFEWRKEVKQAIGIIESVSCIRFIRRTDEKNYIRFVHSLGCWSLVGKFRYPTRQHISLGPGCNNQGIILHELLHALGFFHEISREDRNKYVKINWDNVKGGIKNINFSRWKISSSEYFGGKFDTQSIMMYGNYAFAKDSNYMTMISKERPTDLLGQREGLSQNDIVQLNNKYKCDKNLCRDKFGICSKYKHMCNDATWFEFRPNCALTCKVCKPQKDTHTDNSTDVKGTDSIILSDSKGPTTNKTTTFKKTTTIPTNDENIDTEFEISW
ncbi:hatching enzyme 1.2-like [Clytia hemisphaerica]